ncbi:hypothetical protein P171DRAFT_468827 [Karstenula rhodostoma CBS 690.94]|uniref:Uncharacterized protein n=1 Tax=Karstenula rhodostoma CBS 690.94 TaxID=1392251 RepID=A0A9P4PX68_9PLEO|nr:hypothetical protein P171DRAFT_468827 [Karstenula rhodostoma CBS 690.94]
MSCQKCEQCRRIKQRLEDSHFASCRHTVSPAFQTLFAKLPGQRTCPACLIRVIIYTLRNSRKEVEQCGGIFVSKERNAAEHRWWIHHWNMASVHGWKVVGLLERFDKEWKGNGAERREARRIIEVWMDERRRAGEFLGMVKEVEKEDGQGVPVVKIDEVEIGEEVPIVDADSHHAGVQDTSALIFAGIRSCLKRKRCPEADDTKQESNAKHVKLADCATVSSDYYHIVAHPLLPALCKRPTTEPHRQSAFCRAHKNFCRYANSYKPGRWASPEGFIKQNTSWRGEDWEKFEELMKTEDAEWELQWGEGSRIANAFQVFRAWLAKRMTAEDVGGKRWESM